MDNSQSESSKTCNVSAFNDNLVHMDSLTYESHLTKTKAALSSHFQKESYVLNFFPYFTSLLEDCRLCISQSLDLAVEILQDINLKINKLIQYIQDAVCILQLLSNFIKNTIDSVSMSCCTMKTFPITTGNIMVSVFKHCKDSESIYGINLVRVGKQLKDLFRTCHELQLSYLIIMENHFIFNLTEVEEQKILIDALNINLKIGEIVQTLDVKTMAEQWKAYTVICEKYSHFLTNKYIYSDCTQVLCTMIDSNLASSLEVGVDEKVIIRTLKVTSFIIKILLKIVNIFKHVTLMGNQHIIRTMIYIYLNNDSYLESVGKSSQFTNLIKTNVLTPASSLLRELLVNESFANSILEYDLEQIRNDEKLLGYIILQINVIKLLVRDSSRHCLYRLKNIKRIFEVIPYCHVWFNMSFKFKSESINSAATTYGLYEYLLTHTAALALTLDSSDMNDLEMNMLEALLMLDCCRALFSSNLWILIARMSPSELIQNQLAFLSRTYLQLENYNMFSNSPQQIHLNYTVTRLFELVDNEGKIKLFREFNPIEDETNTNLWIALRMSNFNMDFRRKYEEKLIEKCQSAFDDFFASKTEVEIQHLVKLMKLLATFSISSDKMHDYVMNAWMKACPGNDNHLLKSELDNCSFWYVEFINALIELTSSIINTLFMKPMNLVKVLHVILNIIRNGNTELKMLIIDPLCLLATFHNPENKGNVESLVSESFRRLFQESDEIVKSKLFCKLMKNMRDIKMEKIISLTIIEDNYFKENWRHFLEHGNLKNNSTKIPLKEQLKMVMEFHYTHKCLDIIKDSDSNTSIRASPVKSSSNHFDFADIDNLFENDNDAEPLCKRVKYTNETEEIIARLEKDTLLLGNVKENVFNVDSKNRIKSICEKLTNIID